MLRLPNSRILLPRRFALAALLAVALQHGTAAAEEESAVKKPNCAALAEWAASIDGKDRWQPLEGYRGWLPQAFQAPDFAELFGVPALQWRSEDALEIAALALDCGHQATGARHVDARNALFAARGYFQSNLRGVLGTKEQFAARAAQDAKREAEREAQQAARRKDDAARASARAGARQNELDRVVDQALTAFLDQPASPQQLRTLALLQAIDLNDRTQFENAQRRVGPEARTLMFRLRQQGSDMKDPRVAAKIEARYATLRDELIADYQAKIDGLDNSTQSLRFLASWEQEIGQQMPTLLGQEAVDGLLQQVGSKRRSIQEGIFARAMELIDAAEGNAAGDAAELALIDKIVANSSKAGLTRAQLDEVRAYAGARQQVLAERELAAARERLGDYPETLAGLDKLRRDLISTRRGSLPRADEKAFKGYMNAATARLTEIAEEALPEFERGLAEFPETSEGLQMTEVTLISEEGFDQIDEDVRADYLAALEARRRAISAALDAKVAARRKAALDAGGDADLVGFRFVDTQHGSELDFRDEKLVILNVMGLRAAGDYQVSAEDVIVRGPNGTLVLARSGSGEATKLSGMGMVFRRAAD